AARPERLVSKTWLIELLRSLQPVAVVTIVCGRRLAELLSVHAWLLPVQAVTFLYSLLTTARDTLSSLPQPLKRDFGHLTETRLQRLVRLANCWQIVPSRLG